MGVSSIISEITITLREDRDIYAGNSWANLVLRNQGYQSRFLLDNYLAGFNAITPELMRDKLGTLLALRWGDAERAAKYDAAIVTNQDVFPVLFAYLTDDEGWLEYCPGKLFWGAEFGRRGMIGFEKGEMVLEK